MLFLNFGKELVQLLLEAFVVCDKLGEEHIVFDLLVNLLALDNLELVSWSLLLLHRKLVLLESCDCIVHDMLWHLLEGFEFLHPPNDWR